MRSTLPTQPVIWFVAIVLFLGGTAYLIKGTLLPWAADNDGDMQKLRTEYILFEKGAYPHRFVAEAAGFSGVESYAIYPPYTYPMLAAVFWPRSLEGARVIFQILSAAALVLLMYYGAKELAFAGRAAALLGAAIPFAITGNCSAVAQGQFTIICVAFLALQILLLERDQPVLAGICWAFAMLKPQIGVTFVLLFLVAPKWRGLFAGGLTVTAFTAFAFWWTSVHPLDFWIHGVASHQLGFLDELHHGAGLWITGLGINPQLAVFVGLVLIGAASAAVLLHPYIRSRLKPDKVAALAAVLSMTLIYHRHYDNLLLVFLLFPLVAATLRHKTWPLLSASSLLALTVYTPAGILSKLGQIAPVTDWLIFAIPIAACAVLLCCERRTTPRGAG